MQTVDNLPIFIGTLTQVRTGKVAPFVRGVSAINKTQIEGSMAVNLLGLEDDEQAEHKFHGGHLKAVHQMPITTYDAINAEFGLNAQIGSLGENLTVITDGEPMSERTVCIGDVYQFGEGDDNVQLRVVQPRRPCYKINDKLNNPNVSPFVSRQGIAGWYYQVVKTGILCANLPVFGGKTLSICQFGDTVAIKQPNGTTRQRHRQCVACHRLPRRQPEEKVKQQTPNNIKLNQSLT